LSTKPDTLNPVRLSQVEEFEAGGAADTTARKKTFVEPEVSYPVDVLEATTFFQLADSGSAPPPPVP
jgi:hypothetical protein